MTKRKKGPVVVELDDPPTETPAEAPPVPEVEEHMVTTSPVVVAAELASQPRGTLTAWIWRLGLALFTFVLSLAAWNYVTGLLATRPILGMIAAGLIGLFVFVLLLVALREWLALRRLRRVDALQARAVSALADDDLKAAQGVTGELQRLYKGRADAEWGLSRLNDQQAEVFDADGLLAVAESSVLAPLDAAAIKQVEAAARQVATVTALVPLALADVVAALTANLRMIRMIAEIYGGRGGVFGSWRLAKSVLAHLVATGAVAFGDDMLGSVAGGGILGKLSRRFGEGLVNGALTARVGVAAIEVCRPLPFIKEDKPSVTGILGRALAGFVSSK